MKGNQGSETVSPIANPARLTDFGGLAPAHIEVGDLIELHVHPRVPRGLERFAPNSKVAKRAMNDRVRVIQSR